MTNPNPTCPQCNAPLKLHELAVPRPVPTSTSRLVPKRQCTFTRSRAERSAPVAGYPSR
jgi:hypothetical protein